MKTSFALLPALTLSACGQSNNALTGATSCPLLDAQAQSVMTGSADLPIRCGPQVVSQAGAIQTVTVPTDTVAPVAQPVAIPNPSVVPAESALIVVPNQTGPAIPGQITQLEADFLAAQGVPATQENIDFIRLAVQ